MLWLNRFHEDHMAVVRLLAKLEGNLKDIEYGEAGVNAIWDLREFAELIKNVIIPHFKDEEKIVYPKASGVNEEGHHFIAGMYDEHTALYEAFEGFLKSLGRNIDKKEAPEHGNKPAQVISQSGNANKEEAPKNINKLVQAKTLGEDINKEEILKHGYKIVQMLKEHIEKEEKEVAELVRKANESERS